jgi:glycosyltransferase involved in cell wall biosynthesis
MGMNRTSYDVVMLTTVHRATDVRIFHREAKTLKRAGLSVCVIGPHPRSECLDGILISALPKHQNRVRRLLLGWTVLRQALKLSAKLYIFHDPELFLVAFVLVMAGRRAVFDCHENLTMQILQKPWLPKPLGRVLVPIVSFGLWLGTRVITGVLTERVAMINLFPAQNTIMIRNFPAEDALAVSQGGVPLYLRRNIVIYAGGMFRVRGIRELVEAFRGLQTIAELWLVGEFEEDDFQRQILTSLPANVLWLGRKEFSEVLRLYQLSKVGAVVLYPTPSHRHAIPTKMLEYLGAGLPVIASNFPEWSSLVEGCGVQVDPHDVRQIQDAVRRLLANGSDIAAMSEMARARIAKHFGWKKEGQRLVEYCSRLIYQEQQRRAA